MNPTDTSGSGLGQVPSGGADLPQLGQPSTPHASANVPAQQPHSVLQVTLQQLQKLMTQYSQDPFEQAREIERLKSAYLYKEFGRSVKVADK